MKIVKEFLEVFTRVPGNDAGLYIKANAPTPIDFLQPDEECIYYNVNHHTCMSVKHWPGKELRVSLVPGEVRWKNVDLNDTLMSLAKNATAISGCTVTTRTDPVSTNLVYLSISIQDQ